MRKISAADANRHFSKLLREVKDGETVIVTSHGQPVARMEPVSQQDSENARREEAWHDLIEHLRTRPVLNIPITWSRDDIYDDDF